MCLLTEGIKPVEVVVDSTGHLSFEAIAEFNHRSGARDCTFADLMVHPGLASGTTNGSAPRSNLQKSTSSVIFKQKAYDVEDCQNDGKGKHAEKLT